MSEELIHAIVTVGLTVALPNLVFFAFIFSKVTTKQDIWIKRTEQIAEDVRLIAEHTIRLEVLQNQLAEHGQKIDRLGDRLIDVERVVRMNGRGS